MPTWTNAKFISYAHRSGMSPSIIDSNTAAGPLFPTGVRLQDLEGSGMTLPPDYGLMIWTGTVDQDDDGNIVYTGSWSEGVLADAMAVDAGTAVFAN